MNNNLRPCGRCGRWFTQRGGQWCCEDCIQAEADQTIFLAQWVFLLVVGVVVALIVWMLTK